MAIQFQPTIESICKIALRGSGQPAPSQGMIQEAASEQFREVLNDIKERASNHPLLETSEIKVTTRGVRSQSQPSTCHMMKSILLYDGPSAWRGTAQTGSTTTVTLASSFSEDDDNIIGKPIFLLTGTGALQWKYIKSYNNSTKIVTVDSTWTAPDSTTTYLIANYQNEIYNSTRQMMNYSRSQFAEEGLPYQSAVESETIWFDRPPDKVYPLLCTYYFDIDQLNESSALCKKLLREWRSLLVEGIRAKSMFIYDDTRQYDHHKGIYEVKLNTLSNETVDITQTVPYDVIIC